SCRFLAANPEKPGRASRGRFENEPAVAREAGMRLALVALALLAMAAPVSAKDSLGVFGDWGAILDPQVPRCYAIAAARNDARDHAPFASVGTWPQREVRGQVHVRLSRNTRSGATIALNVGGDRFELTGSGADAWARD